MPARRNGGRSSLPLETKNPSCRRSSLSFENTSQTQAQFPRSPTCQSPCARCHCNSRFLAVVSCMAGGVTAAETRGAAEHPQLTANMYSLQESTTQREALRRTASEVTITTRRPNRCACVRASRMSELPRRQIPV